MIERLAASQEATNLPQRAPRCDRTSERLATAPGLLVSVRSVAEARCLAGLEIAVLDIKEPLHGALAPATKRTWDAIVANCEADNDDCSPRVAISIALGEIEDALAIAADVPASAKYAKAGPAGCTSIGLLREGWSQLRHGLPAGVELVAVAYADHELAGCPAPMRIFEAAVQCGLTTWLLDTKQKDGRSSCDWLSFDDLREIQSLAMRHDRRWVLAGSITQDTMALLQAEGLQPDLYGVRGAVCKVSREGTISRGRAQRLLDQLRHVSHRERE